MAVSVEATLRAWHYLNPHLVPIFSCITAGVVDESRNQLWGSNFGTAACRASIKTCEACTGSERYRFVVLCLHDWWEDVILTNNHGKLTQMGLAMLVGSL